MRLKHQPMSHACVLTAIQVSAYEATRATADAPLNARVIDPQRAVKPCHVRVLYTLKHQHSNPVYACVTQVSAYEATDATAGAPLNARVIDPQRAVEPCHVRVLYTLKHQHSNPVYACVTQVSVFEATDDTANAPLNARVIDPRRAVKRFRRSAAGVDLEDAAQVSLRISAQLLLLLRISAQQLLRISAQQLLLLISAQLLSAVSVITIIVAAVPRQLRTLGALRTTTRYLLRDVFCAHAEGTGRVHAPVHEVYSFVDVLVRASDMLLAAEGAPVRVRKCTDLHSSECFVHRVVLLAVRKTASDLCTLWNHGCRPLQIDQVVDMVVQQLMTPAAADIIEQMCRFYIISGYLLHGTPIHHHDTTLHARRRRECLGLLKDIYALLPGDASSWRASRTSLWAPKGTLGGGTIAPKGGLGGGPLAPKGALRGGPIAVDAPAGGADTGAVAAATGGGGVSAEVLQSDVEVCIEDLGNLALEEDLRARRADEAAAPSAAAAAAAHRSAPGSGAQSSDTQCQSGLAIGPPSPEAPRCRADALLACWVLEAAVDAVARGGGQGGEGGGGGHALSGVLARAPAGAEVHSAQQITAALCDGRWSAVLRLGARGGILARCLLLEALPHLCALALARMNRGFMKNYWMPLGDVAAALRLDTTHDARRLCEALGLTVSPPPARDGWDDGVAATDRSDAQQAKAPPSDAVQLKGGAQAAVPEGGLPLLHASRWVGDWRGRLWDIRTTSVITRSASLSRQAPDLQQQIARSHRIMLPPIVRGGGGEESSRFAPHAPLLLRPTVHTCWRRWELQVWQSRQRQSFKTTTDCCTCGDGGGDACT
ncbi:hypothetical protein JKP88DRAFT_261668 [Tribonema minus]|uniref:SAC3/GANP/THP3 conserved domain-containing protein n=1 Tax=Tribonema minus TaxID=303371 RepID=A0A836C791_9STRA|nr:hypothetical protein JKP88DRAFT_261668 [Tribonema minus]